MIPWTDRPDEVARLFNPAFWALLVREAIKGYTAGEREGIELGLLFLILPIVLHGRTRGALPTNPATHLQAWLEDNPDVQVGLARRIEAVAPHTREAVVYALQYEALSVGESGLIRSGTARLRRYTPQPGSEAEECVQRSGFLGRWFAKTGDPATVLSLWGIRL